MVAYKKRALEIEQQIAKLKAQGLFFADEAYAHKILSQISYHRLSGYAYPFQDQNDSGKFKYDGIRFEDIIRLYEFDNQLRLEIFKSIRLAEIVLRTTIVQDYSTAYGSHWHIQEDLYSPNEIKHYKQNLQKIEDAIKRSKDIFIEQYQEKYSEPTIPPAWMTLEIISLGQLSKIYNNLHPKDDKRIKKQIAQKFGLITPRILENWFLCLNRVRNICAHHTRLWNAKLTPIKLPRKLPKGHTQFLTKEEIGQIRTEKLYAFLCCLIYLLDNSAGSHDFKNSIKELMNDCPLNQSKAMGFIEGWEQHPLWN